MGKWIQDAINPKHKGMEKRAASKAGMSTHAYMEKHKDDAGSAGKRARLGLTLSGLKKGGSVMAKVPKGDISVKISDLDLHAGEKVTQSRKGGAIKRKKSGGAMSGSLKMNNHPSEDCYRAGGSTPRGKGIESKSRGACAQS